MILQVLIYLQTLVLAMSVNFGQSTQFGENDPGNPNPHLACVPGFNVKDDMPVVAHRKIPCGTKVIICKLNMSKCTKAIVGDRLGNHCKKWKKGKCIKYWSDLDMTRAVGKEIDHKGYEPVLYIDMETPSWQRKENLNLLKKRKHYIRLNS